MKTKRVISTVVVSIISFLLASSFVLHTSAETIEQVLSLQSVTAVPAISGGEEIDNQADLDSIADLAVSSENNYFDGTFSKGEFVVKAGYAKAFNIGDAAMVYFNSSGNASIDLVGSIRSYSYSQDVPVTSNQIFVMDEGYWYAGGGNLSFFKNGATSSIFSTTYDGSIVSLYVFETNLYYIVICGYKDATLRASVYNKGFVWVQTYTYDVNSSNDFNATEKDGIIYIHCYGHGYIYTFDTTSFTWGISSAYVTSTYFGPMCFIGDNLYLFSLTRDVYRVFSSDFLTYQDYTYPVSFNLKSYNYASDLSASYVNGKVYIPLSNFTSSTTYLILSTDTNYWYNLMDYNKDSTFIPDRYINFSYLSNSDGIENGDGHLGLELNFGIPDTYYNSHEVTGFEFTCISAVSSTTDDFANYDGIAPLYVDTGGSANVLPVLGYELIGQFGDVYVYAFTCVIFLDNGNLTSLKITINNYIPTQTETHSFSLPVSALTLKTWEDAESAISEIGDKVTILQETVEGTNERLDKIQNILTSVPPDHSEDISRFDDDISRFNQNLSEEQENNSIINSYAESFFADNSIPAEISGGIVDANSIIAGFDSGERASFFDFFVDLWSIHPMMNTMVSVIVVLSISCIIIRLS